MLLEGSCHCQAVQFSLQAKHPYPFNLCYCSICRKTAGGGGLAINLGGDRETLRIASGSQHIRKYHARMVDDETGDVSHSPAERAFCGLCGSALWVWAPRWPELVHPHASAIDTELPVAPEHTHHFLGSKAGWVEPCIRDGDKEFDEFPQESIAAWHQRLGVER